MASTVQPLAISLLVSSRQPVLDIQFIGIIAEVHLGAKIVHLGLYPITDVGKQVKLRLDQTR